MVQKAEVLLKHFSFLQELSTEEVAEWDRQVEQDIAEQQRKEREKAFQSCGIGERYFTENFDTFIPRGKDEQNLLENLRLFALEVKAGKFATVKLLGNVGTGKTHLAAAVLRETGGIYRVSDAIVNEVREAERFDVKEDKEKVIQRYATCSFLVIDEIGRCEYPEREKHILYRIINGRYENRLPTLLISNFNKMKFADFVGAATTDRLNESCQTYELTGSSYRTTIREQSRA
jgi:DNA replication protein DnaC